MDIMAMGEYGAYVWSSFTLTLIVLIVCTLQAKHRHEKTVKNLRTRLRAMESEE